MKIIYSSDLFKPFSRFHPGKFLDKAVIEILVPNHMQDYVSLPCILVEWNIVFEAQFA